VLAAAVVEPMPARADSWLVLPSLDFVALGDLVLSKSTTLSVSSPVVGTGPSP
jgi:hypothetical protein